MRIKKEKKEPEMQNNDNLSTNINNEEDFTLPNLEEGLNIDEIPSIEDLISLDKEEIEKIQKNEIDNVFNDNSTDTSNVFEENIDAPLTPPENNEQQEINSFDRDFDSMNLFDEEVDLTLDEPAVNDNIMQTDLSMPENDNILKEEPEIVEDANTPSFENITPDITFDDTNDVMPETDFSVPEQPEINFSEPDLSFEPEIVENTNEQDLSDNPDAFNMPEEDNEIEFNDNNEDDSFDYSLDENNQSEETDITDDNDSENILENVSETASEDLTFEVEDTDNDGISEFHQEEEMPAETTETDSYSEELPVENEELLSESADETEQVETPQAETNQEYSGETKHYSSNTDVFAKIDSLLNDDSAFETPVQNEKTPLYAPQSSEDITDESIDDMPKPRYKSSFDPSKYMKKSQKIKVSEDTEEKLGILYTARKVFDNIKTLKDELNLGDNPSISSLLQNENSKKALIAAAVCVVVLGAGIAGVSVLNNKSVEEINTLNNNDISTPLETASTPAQEVPPAPDAAATSIPSAPSAGSTPLIDENSNVSADVPELDKKPPAEIKQDVIKETVAQQTKPPINPESYLTVKKIQWQVPDYLSYSPNIKSYLQSAGKSIKLSLSSDLLLATEYAYSNVVKINLKISNNGAVQNATVATSSGSKQIDNIVLQSVKTTLNVVKPPAGEIKTPDFNLTLTINL